MTKHEGRYCCLLCWAYFFAIQFFLSGLILIILGSICLENNPYWCPSSSHSTTMLVIGILFLCPISPGCLYLGCFSCNKVDFSVFKP